MVETARGQHLPGGGAWGRGRRDFSPACGSGVSACVAGETAYKYMNGASG